MREKAKVTNRRNVDDLKGAVRKAEGLLEIFALMLCYYFIWKYSYRNALPHG